MSKIVIQNDAKIVYDYQQIIIGSSCPSCNLALSWAIKNPNTAIGKTDDLFCYAECCGMNYFMAPEKVRIIPIPVANIKSLPIKDEEDETDEFIKMLEQF